MQPSNENRMAGNPGYRTSKLWLAAGAGWILCAAALTLPAQPPVGAGGAAADGKKTDADKQAAGDNRVSVAVARERAMVMHDIYESTLHVMHQRYFHSNRAVLPARAMEDVFAEMARKSKAKARWISVNTRAMSVDHEPEDEFETQAAAALAAGKEKFELIEKGFYRSASPIPLGAGCVSCHTGFFAGAPKSQRLAGLVISVPVNEE